MDIEHLGPSLIDQLVESSLVRDPSDLYRLTAPEVARLERMAEKSAANLIGAIEESRGRTLDRLITGLGIPFVGEVAAKQLAERYRSLSELEKREAAIEREALAEIHGIGPKIADAVASALEDERFMRVIRKLLEYGLDPRQPGNTGASVGPLDSKSFCVTGTLSRPRAAVHEMIKAAGGEVHKTVTKKTDYLVTGDNVGQSKIKKAKSTGARVISEETLLSMMDAGAPTGEP
jgi:DNA ligase (NAD+)